MEDRSRSGRPKRITPALQRKVIETLDNNSRAPLRKLPTIPRLESVILQLTEYYKQMALNSKLEGQNLGFGRLQSQSDRILQLDAIPTYPKEYWHNVVILDEATIEYGPYS